MVSDALWGPGADIEGIMLKELVRIDEQSGLKTKYQISKWLLVDLASDVTNVGQYFPFCWYKT